MHSDQGDERFAPWRRRIHEIIFEADTRAGKTFDVVLLVGIVLSVLVVMLESITPVREAYGGALRTAEWTFTILFTVEYGLRLISVQRPILYARSFYGIVDLLAIFPTYLSLVVTGTQSLLVIRTLRLLRVFRVFKLARYLGEVETLRTALHASRRKIVVFLCTVLSAVIIVGSLMYLIEGEENGFTSIPRSMYWAIVTMTTVGYGDVTPQTPAGQALAAALMIVGYGILAVPTGIVTAEIVMASRDAVSTQVCPVCASEGHDLGARFCKQCGARM